MKKAFVCWRPYQVFNSVNIALHKQSDDDICDLFMDDTPALVKCRERIIASGVFSHVYVYRVPNIQGKNKLHTLMRSMSNDIFCKRNVCRYLQDKEADLFHYDEIYASGWEPYFVELANANPNASVFMFEDGTSTYRMKDEREYIGGVYLKACKILKQLFHCGPLNVKIKYLYVNNKELLTQEWDCPILEAPIIDDNVLSVIKNIFVVSENDIQMYRSALTTFLGQPRFDETQTLEILFRNNVKFIYRPHPTEIGKEIPNASVNGAIIDHQLPMWEIISNELGNSNILIGVFSTAQITPFMIYHKSPILIFTYKMHYTENNKEYARMGDFIKQFREKYPGRIYEPANYEELDLLFKELES